MSQNTSSTDETHPGSSVKHAFVQAKPSSFPLPPEMKLMATDQDAITDAAIDQLAFDLATNNLIDLFARAFHPERNTILSLAPLTSENALSILPNSHDIIATNFNWAAVIFVGLMGISGILFFVHARKVYDGPVALVEGRGKDA